MTVPSPAERAQSLRVLIICFIAAAGIIGVVIFWTLGGVDAPHQPAVIAVFLVATVVVAAIMDRHWLRLPALRTEEADPNAKAHEILVAHTIFKFAFIEAVLMIAVAVGFVVESGWPVITTALAVIASLAVVVWPSPRNVTRVATKLESEGVRTSLVQDFVR